MDKKKVIIVLGVVCVILVMALVGVIVFTTSKNENDEKGNNQISNIQFNNIDDEKSNTNIGKKSDNTYNEMYKEYLEKEVFSDAKIDKIVGSYFNVSKSSKPVLIIKYQGKDSSFYIRVLHITGDEILAGKDIKATSMSCAYSMEDKEIVYFIGDISNEKKYKSVTDIVNEKANILELKESGFGKDYILFDDEIKFYTIKRDEIEENLEDLDKKLKNMDMTSIDSKIKEIEANRLKMDENGIFNEKYRIPFGTYSYNPKTSITIKADNSVHYEFVIQTGLGMPVKYDGSFYLENDKIMCKVRLDDPEFIIIDNNKIQRVSDNTVWHLENN